MIRRSWEVSGCGDEGRRQGVMHRYAAAYASVRLFRIAADFDASHLLTSVYAVNWGVFVMQVMQFKDISARYFGASGRLAVQVVSSGCLTPQLSTLNVA